MTSKQQIFCEAYLVNGFNATKAALTAGYSKKTAYSIGDENLKKPEIQQYISKRKEKISEKLHVTHEMLTSEFAKIAFSSVSNLHDKWIELKDFEMLTDDQKACIKSIDTKKEIRKTEENTFVDVIYVKITLHDKIKALENLGKHIGYYEKDNEQGKTQIYIGGMEIK